MTPRTRSATKASPGRMTRNSLYGRPPPQPRKPRKSAIKSTTATAPVAEAVPEVETEDVLPNDENKGPVRRTPWLACRDAYGAYTTVTVSQTGKGVHVRWHDDPQPGPADEQDAEEEADVDMSLDASNERATTPAFVAGPSNLAHRHVPQTPIDLRSFDAGSVIRTPVKKMRQLQRSPIRIGDKGIRCLYDQGGVLRDLNTGDRYVLNHPLGSSANLSRWQVEQQERERERKIVEEQMRKLLEEKRRLEEQPKPQPQQEMEYFSDSGYEEEMDTDEPARLESGVPPFFEGPRGELLDRFGRQMLGPEGTILIYNGSDAIASWREGSLAPTEIIEEEMEEEDAYDEEEQEPRFRKVRFGPEGTELID